MQPHKKQIESSYENFRFKQAIAATMQRGRRGNRYCTETEPWKTRKENPEACGNTLHVSLQVAAALSILFEPVMPDKMKQLRADLAISEEIKWEDVSSQILTPGEKILEGKILFHKIEDDAVKAQIGKLKERSDQVEQE